MFCSVSKRIHRNPPEEQRKFFFALLKTWIHLINLTRARPILQKSRYRILLICMWNLAFIEEQKRTARKGAEWCAIIFISIIVFS